MTDRSETHPLTNLEQHVQRGYQVTRNCTEGEVGNMPVRNEGKWEREGGDNQGATCIRTTASEDPEGPSDASSKLGLFTGRGAFGRGRSFGGEVMLLARSTG